MNETISRYWARVNQYWKQTNRTNKLMFFAIIAFAVITIALLIYNFSKTEYALAYTDLSPTDAAAIKNHLESKGIPYRFSADGTSIGVPAKRVTEVKLDVASQDLIHNGSQGFGIFRDNMSGFGMTDNEFKVLSVDARAGEIQKLINSYEGVLKSQVLLSIPEESVFINSGEPEEALASVVITFKPGHRPRQEMIDGIYNLVKTGVAKLPLENITITDQNGMLLTSSDMNGGVGVASTLIEQQMQIKKMYEADIQKNIKSFLGTLYDSNRVAVSVVASLNFDQVNSHVKTYSPVNEEDQTGIVRSEDYTEKSMTSDSGGGAGGVPGTGETNVPNYPGSSQDTGRTTSDEIHRTTNYEINEMTQSIVSSPYVVKDLTIFVGIEPPEPGNPDSLSEERVNEIRRMLTSVVSSQLANSGQNLTQEQLSDKVSVLAQSFRGVPSTSESSNAALWYYALGGAALALAAAGGLYFIRRRNKQEELEEDEPFIPEVEHPTLDIDQVGNESQMRKQLENLAKKKPEEFVNLLRTWLADE